MKFRSSIPAFFLAIGLAASPALGAAAWDGAPWRLEKIGPAAVLGKGKAALSITPDGKVSGSSGCNRFGGTAQIENGGLRFGPLAGTRMACPPEMMDQERRLFHALEEVRAARVEDGRLVLLSESGEALVTLSR